MRVALYARVSTKEQNPEMQLVELRRYAANRGFEIVQEYVECVSSRKKNRPQLIALMDAAKKRKFDAVLVWKFDRFARSVRHLVQALEEFQGIGIQFLSYTENIDTSSSMGQAMFSVMGAMAQLERDLISERTSTALRIAKENGVILGRKRLKRIPEVLSLRENGFSIRQIAEKLNLSIGHTHRTLKECKKVG